MATFTVYWSDDMCEHAEAHGLAGAPLRILWGGWNQQTQYARYRFGPGDRVIVVHLANTFVHLVGSMTVTRKCTRDEWLAERPSDKKVAGGAQIVAGRDGTEVRFDRALPLDVVERIDFQSANAARRIKHVEEGRLKRAEPLFGVFRVTDETALSIEPSFATPEASPRERDPVLERLFVGYRATPDDPATAAVVADALSERGDPRGEVIAFELALRGEKKHREYQKIRGRLERATNASPRLLVGKPGGFPLRAAWGPPRRPPPGWFST